MQPDTEESIAVLPEFFRPRSGVSLVRVGNANDGGYLIDERNLAHADFLICMGLYTDWSFEAAFLARRQVPLVAYDASVSAWEFCVLLYRRLVLFEPVNAWIALKVLAGYLRFFNATTRRHKCKHVGPDSGAKVTTLDSILRDDIGDRYQRVFFNIDIEGGEYHLLDALVACADRIEGLVIEFHDVDRHLPRIQAFLDAFPLGLCHVHANNTGLVLANRTPTVIECSFTRHQTADPQALDLPHPLDTANWSEQPDLAIRFAPGS